MTSFRIMMIIEFFKECKIEFYFIIKDRFFIDRKNTGTCLKVFTLVREKFFKPKTIRSNISRFYIDIIIKIKISKIKLEEA
jgi:hypothetical protein